jgi:hypothetical protein
VIPPPIFEPSPGHRILCHLPHDELMAMLPVIEVEDAGSREAAQTH